MPEKIVKKIQIMPQAANSKPHAFIAQEAPITTQRKPRWENRSSS